MACTVQAETHRSRGPLAHGPALCSTGVCQGSTPALCRTLLRDRAQPEARTAPQRTELQGDLVEPLVASLYQTSGEWLEDRSWSHASPCEPRPTPSPVSIFAVRT